MADILTPEMNALIAAMGRLVKADPRSAALQDAIEDYERNEELNEMVARYQKMQNDLTDAYAGETLPDAEFTEAAQAEIDDLYDAVVNHPVYAAFEEAKNAFEELTNEVFSELQFAMTGRRACGHDCASCSGCR